MKGIPEPKYKEGKKVKVICIGHYCSGRFKTFMSPDSTRIRQCPKCSEYSDKVREYPRYAGM